MMMRRLKGLDSDKHTLGRIKDFARGSTGPAPQNVAFRCIQVLENGNIQTSFMLLIQVCQKRIISERNPLEIGQLRQQDCGRTL